MVRRALVAALALVALSASRASAQDAVDFSKIDFAPAGFSHLAVSSLKLSDLEQMALPIQFAPVPKQKRSALNTSLYSSIALMQALDVHSTFKAFNVGATERNPLMSGIAKSPVAFIATKAAVAATTILAVRHLAKRSRVAAIITTVAVNSAYAMVVRHNYNVANGR